MNIASDRLSLPFSSLFGRCLAPIPEPTHPVPSDAGGRVKKPSQITFARCLLPLLAACCPVTLSADEGVHFFETKVRPVLAQHCQQCHGGKKQESGLRLDSLESVLLGGDGGPAVVPGKPGESLLVRAVRHTGDLAMPPSGKLKDHEIEALAHWIEIGVPWPTSFDSTGVKLAETQRQHWAFKPIPQVTPPAVGRSDWARTPIDRFILAKLESSGLSPSESADRRTLIRRVTLDLTGLFPTPEEVDAFVKDSAPDAYDKLVDRLLASPKYGEQWARHWLDVARYADTKGYVYAREERFWVHASAYRDWVVEAFQRDLPYDQFLLLQIAADQAAPDDLPARAAMGFLTLGRRFLGVTHDIIDDRIDVVTRGTMGLTVACARCHDHKYDPIPTADYYSLYGVFLNSTEELTPIGSPAVHDDAFEKELAKRKETLNRTLLAKRNEASDRVRKRVADYLVAQTELSNYAVEGFDQVFATTDVIPTFVRRFEAWLALKERWRDPVFAPWRRFASLKPEEFSARSAALVDELAQAKPPINPLVLWALTPPPQSMREVAERYGKLLRETEDKWQATLESAKRAKTPAPTRMPSADSEALRQFLYAKGSPCLVPDEPIVSCEWYFDTDTINAMWKLQGEVDRWLIQSPVYAPHAVALRDREFIRPARIHRRGSSANLGPEVSRHFVSVIAGQNPKNFTQGSGRLELAKAIINPANPLTARVWVNRVWQHHFGAGLVRTPSDFGVRADPPSHPELLDWLATRFMAEGWSTKSLHRMILLSKVYQQRSDTVASGRAREIDPGNRLLWRMNSRRLTFEEYRDNLLASAGRLDPQRGGRATDLFASQGTVHRRRTLYGLVDRQFLATTLRVFDFANPDLHTPARSETTAPQQALFALNHPFVAQQAKALARQIGGDSPMKPEEKVKRLYRAAYQRDPRSTEVGVALQFVSSAPLEKEPPPRPESLAWRYGYGEIDVEAQKLKSFHALPYFSGTAWQGSESYPDPSLGWVQLSARGGHPGNDNKHASIRRWVAPHDGDFSVHSLVNHEAAEGNGIRCWIFSSRDGMLQSLTLRQQKKEMNLASVKLGKGETLDFVVDIHGELNNDQYLWAPVIKAIGSTQGPNKSVGPWNAELDFQAPRVPVLDSWEQLAQVLLMSNELMFVD